MFSGYPMAVPLLLDTPVKYLKGVGPRRGELLAKRGVATVEDLLYHLPFRYEDRSRLRTIREIQPGETATIIAQVQTISFRRTRRGASLLSLTVGDGSGSILCVWYNADYLHDRFKSGDTLALHGRVDREAGRIALRQPEFEMLESKAASAAAPLDSLKIGRIVPIYEAIGVLSSGHLRWFVHRALSELPDRISDALPDELRERLRLPDRRTALEQVHFPTENTPLDDLQNARTPGHLRLILEELFFLQAGLELKRRKVKRRSGAAIAVDRRIREAVKRLLPFHPTDDQKRVLGEIVKDMCSGHPMRRLLQGDVGCGKTIVALEAAVIAMENGHQVAMMAPTQILAEQHYLYARERLPNYKVQLVTSATSRRRKFSARTAQLAIGTQALLERNAALSNPGLIIVDEQHRFGVMQRFELMQPSPKSEAAAHVLVMTATPIPRTLALSLYSDLDSSLIHQTPPGGLPVTTRAVPAARSEDVYRFVEGKLEGGRQAYFVYPLIEESDALNLKPALLMFEVLCRRFGSFHVGLLHGRMTAEEKAKVMAEFRSGRIQVLVSTTVIEVGVDVPNATLMVIEHAERFGIAQLHQLRGRIGRPQRGDAYRQRERSYCLLVYSEPCTEYAQKRLEALVRSRDGFELAELDLKLRGPGEVFGTRQSGLPGFTIADPLRDRELMEMARQEASVYLDRADANQLRSLVQQIQQRWQRKYGLIEVG